MTFRTAAAALATIALVVVPSDALAGKSPNKGPDKGKKSHVREFTGTVSWAKGKSFQLSRSGRPTLTFRLSRKTKVAKGAKPRTGRQLVVKARRGKRGWVARSIKLVPVPVARGKDEDGESLDDDEPKLDEESGEEDDSLLDLEETLGDDTFDDLVPDSEE